MASSIRRFARALHSNRTIISKTLNPRLSSSSPPIPLPRYFEQNKGSNGSSSSETIARGVVIPTVLAGSLGFGLDVAYAESNEAAADTPPSTEAGEIPAPSESGKTTPILPPVDTGKTPPIPPPIDSGKTSIPPPIDSCKTPIPPPTEPAKTTSPPTPPPTEPAKTPAPPVSTLADLEEIAKKEKLRLETLLRTKGVKQASCPRFTVAVKGQKLTIKFKVPPSCEIPMLITSLVSRLGVTPGDSSVGSDMMLRAWDSGVAWQLTLSRPKHNKQNAGGEVQSKDTNSEDGDLCILMFRPLISSDRAEIEFMKGGSFTSEELEALASVMQIAGQPKSVAGKPNGDASRTPDKTIASLESMGVKIYGLQESNKLVQSNGENQANISWDNIAGYDHQKRDIEDTILLALKSPEVYDDIARGTRRKFETNRPRAVLFEGPPGTGKTSCARVIANEAGVPLLYVPLEVIMSKYYGESERMLGKVFSLADEIPNGAIVFLDEVDSVATARDSETHEATRRLLSVLLRQIDGFEQDKKVVVVAATNRKQDLDPALLSRFDCMITFGLPDQRTREEIAAQYAKHLSKSELAELSVATEEMSGRDIRDVCQQAERQWASKVIRGQTEQEEQGLLPPVNEYIQCALRRKSTMQGIESLHRNPLSSKRNQFDFM